MKITHLNPDSLHKNPAFSQAVTVEGQVKMIYVGGQNGITADGKMDGDDLGAQSERALINVLAALQAAGASQENVVKLTIYIVQGHDINFGFAAAQKVWGMYPTAISVLIVAGLANPQALVEVDAVAAVEA
jgi:enamine deaminase RidA (YjgF/YER057c/UK114 family)